MQDYFDIHTHSNVKEENVFSILNIHQGEQGVLDASTPCSIGLHPWFLTRENAREDLSWLEENITRKNVWALGECGLDRLKGEDLDFQQKIFEAQVALAEANNKPVVIHCVKAFSELVESVKRVQPKVPLIIHGFNKKISLWRQLEKEDFYFSFGAAILNENSPSHSIIQEIPQDRFFLETDDSNISIKKIYEQAANLRNSSMNDILAAVYENLKNIGIDV